MWQEIIVALIVAAALVHFSTKYLPVSLRRRIVYTLGKRGFDEVKLARFFKTQGGGGCGDDGGGCSSCGSCDTTPTKSNTSTPQHRVIKLHVQR
ncbi:hypothetical protein SAMN05192549_10657 [Duganella sacchari]|uniref:Uncharacterized protein n=1 Tax=Duganella sacchari TaxID=551987 RepID=A0A1M7Q123_9BURK|nr:DUF6587 family protein [Duganella sacchari]SHN23778.1 hypothetical protein SAMN05192549_10657 [Duganella sacchari]